MVLDVIDVLAEERREDDHLVAGVEDGAQNDVGRAGRAAGHEDVGDAEGQAGFGGQGVGNRLSRFRIAGVGHVAVHTGRGGLSDAEQFGVELRRRLHDRVPQGQVENVVIAVLRLEGDAHLEHAADPAAFFHGTADVFGDGHERTPWRRCRDGDNYSERLRLSIADPAGGAFGDHDCGGVGVGPNHVGAD